MFVSSPYAVFRAGELGWPPPPPAPKSSISSAGGTPFPESHAIAEQTGKRQPVGRVRNNARRRGVGIEQGELPWAQFGVTN